MSRIKIKRGTDAEATNFDTWKDDPSVPEFKSEAPVQPTPEPDIRSDVETHVQTSPKGRTLYKWEKRCSPEGWYFEGEYYFTADLGWESVKDRGQQLYNMALEDANLGYQAVIDPAMNRTTLQYVKLPKFNPQTARIRIRVEILG